MAELQIYGIDEFKIEKQEKEDIEGLRSIFFKDVYPNEVKTRVLQIKNQTTVRVKFHWSLFTNDRDSK